MAIILDRPRRPLLPLSIFLLRLRTSSFYPAARPPILSDFWTTSTKTLILTQPVEETNGTSLGKQQIFRIIFTRVVELSSPTTRRRSARLRCPIGLFRGCTRRLNIQNPSWIQRTISTTMHHHRPAAAILRSRLPHLYITPLTPLLGFHKPRPPAAARIRRLSLDRALLVPPTNHYH